MHLNSVWLNTLRYPTVDSSLFWDGSCLVIFESKTRQASSFSFGTEGVGKPSCR